MRLIIKQKCCFSSQCLPVNRLRVMAICLSLLMPMAQASVDGDLAGSRIESVAVRFNDGQQENTTYRDAALKAFGVYPGTQFDPVRSNMMLNQLRRLKFVNGARYQVHTASNGNVELTLDITLSNQAKSLDEAPIGLFANGNGQDFPTLYADDRTVLQAKLENKSMLFSNNNAFFGRPDVLTSGNPLATSPSGKDGMDTWLESSVEAGLYGLTALNGHLSAFAGSSVIASGSWGPELFTDKTRSHVDVEDAYVGLIDSQSTDKGGVRQFSVLYGRKAFQVDNGMILRLSSANGGGRAALQSNPRNAAQELFHVQFVHDGHKVELFRLDPDELEETDSKTVMHGINYEGRILSDLRLGAMWLDVPKSRFSYYTTSGSLSRQGLRVADLRLAYEPPASVSAVFVRGELARQTHRDFDMDARAAYVEAGYQFAKAAWRPTLSYRYSTFSGDKSDTKTFERWDPLFAGGGGDEWVQGLNQYKVVQTSNVIAHRVMARLQVAPRWELTPQFWVFKADTLNNLGGAQALSTLTSHDLGKELNLTARYVASPNLIFVMSAAYTQPGKAIRDALNNDYRNWLSASALMIARF